MCAIDWDESQVDVQAIHRSSVDRARTRFRAQLPELVWNAAALEGNTYTLPEVRTLLEGVTVGGKRVEEAEQILDLSQAYSRLDEMVGAGTFRLDKVTSDKLHAILARHEARDAGGFRGEGSATGGGHVRLSDGTRVEGVDTGPGGVNLRRRAEDLLAYIEAEPDPRMQGLVYFAAATRTQFYFDGNKRTARLMMTGHLMSSGFDAVSVPAARRLEFNQALDVLFATDDATTLMAFLATCTLD
jgi:Fic family protein